MLSVIILITTVFLGCLLYIYRELGAKSNDERDKNINNNTEKGTERDNKLENLDSRMKDVEKLLGVISFMKSQESIDRDNESFKEFLRKNWNLTYDQFQNILETSIKQEENNLNKAVSLYIKGYYKESLKVFLDIGKLSNHDKVAAVANSFIGNLCLNYNVCDDKMNAEEYLKKAEEIFTRLNNASEYYEVQRAELYTDLGIYYKRLGDFNKSKKYYNKSLDLYKDLNEKYKNKYTLDIGKQYHNLFVLHYDYKTPDSLPYLMKAYQFKKKHFEIFKSDLPDLINTLNSLGNYFNKLNFEKSKKYFEEGFNLMSSHPEEDKSVKGLLNRANLLANYGFSLKLNAKTYDDLRRSISIMEEAEKAFDFLFEVSPQESKINYSNCVHNIGVAYSQFYDETNSAEDFAKSNDHYLKAIKTREELQATIPGFTNDVFLAHSYVSYSNLLSKRSNRQAIDYAKKSIRLYNNYLNLDSSLQQYVDLAEKIINSFN